MTVSFSKSAAATCTVGDSVKDAYISIYGSSTSTYDAIVDLRIDGTDYDSDYAIRHKNEDGNKTIEVTNATFAADTWTHIEMTWDASAADDSTAPLVTVKINDTAVSDAWNSYGESLVDMMTGAQTFAFKLGDTGAVMSDCKYQLDNIKIYSTDDAGDTLIWADNFEGFTDGDSLDTDNAASPYHSNTAEAVVATEGS